MLEDHFLWQFRVDLLNDRFSTVLLHFSYQAFGGKQIGPEPRYLWRVNNQACTSLLRITVPYKLSYDQRIVIAKAYTVKSSLISAVTNCLKTWHYLLLDGLTPRVTSKSYTFITIWAVYRNQSYDICLLTLSLRKAQCQWVFFVTESELFALASSWCEHTLIWAICVNSVIYVQLLNMTSVSKCFTPNMLNGMRSNFRVEIRKVSVTQQVKPGATGNKINMIDS